VVKKEYSYTSTPSVGRTVSTEPQCLYKGELNFLLPLAVKRKTIFCYENRCCVGFMSAGVSIKFSFFQD